MPVSKRGRQSHAVIASSFYSIEKGRSNVALRPFLLSLFTNVLEEEFAELPLMSSRKFA